MATNTTNLALVKPATSDAVDITVINSNMDKIDSIVGSKPLGDFSSLSELDTLLNTELASMAEFTQRAIYVHATATFGGLFINNYNYFGTLYKNKSGANYAHVMLYANAQNHVITGNRAGGASWTYGKLVTADNVDATLSSMIGNLQVYTKTIPANGGTATIRASKTMPCLVFTSFAAAATCFSGYYASILSSAAPAYMPLFTPGSKVALSAASGGGLIVTNTNTAGISLIVIRLMGDAEVTITTASA